MRLHGTRTGHSDGARLQFTTPGGYSLFLARRTGDEGLQSFYSGPVCVDRHSHHSNAVTGRALPSGVLRDPDDFGYNFRCHSTTRYPGNQRQGELFRTFVESGQRAKVLKLSLPPFECTLQTNHPQLEMFWRQLLVQRTYFNACGMCKIDRHILTSVGPATSVGAPGTETSLTMWMTNKTFSSLPFQYCATVATYLVILLQFQRTDGWWWC